MPELNFSANRTRPIPVSSNFPNSPAATELSRNLRDAVISLVSRDNAGITRTEESMMVANLWKCLQRVSEC